MKRGMVAATLALTLVLLAGCGGGGNDQAKVEADLQRHMLGMPPEQTGFPMGLGPPKVKAGSCRDRNVRVEKRDVMWSSTRFGVPVGSAGALWGCVVKLGTYVTQVHVLVVARTRVVRVWQGELIRTRCMADERTDERAKRAKAMPDPRARGTCALVARGPGL
jgi:hypothetical protein